MNRCFWTFLAYPPNTEELFKRVSFIYLTKIKHRADKKFSKKCASNIILNKKFHNKSKLIFLIYSSMKKGFDFRFLTVKALTISDFNNYLGFSKYSFLGKYHSRLTQPFFDGKQLLKVLQLFSWKNNQMKQF